MADKPDREQNSEEVQEGTTAPAGATDASPVLRQSVVKRLTDTLDLRNGTRVATYPCRPASIRGLRARVVLMDELAFFRSTEGAAVDAEMLTAARPALATTGGKLIIISSPYGQAGSLWELHRRHHGDDDSDVLVWQASAPEMNPISPIRGRMSGKRCRPGPLTARAHAFGPGLSECSRD